MAANGHRVSGDPGAPPPETPLTASISLAIRGHLSAMRPRVAGGKVGGANRHPLRHEHNWWSVAVWKSGVSPSSKNLRPLAVVYPKESSSRTASVALARPTTRPLSTCKRTG